jgi:ABC-type lipoprotein export system ATPase subunit/ABC-type lipoprotein release transport system permease subunit
VTLTNTPLPTVESQRPPPDMLDLLGQPVGLRTDNARRVFRSGDVEVVALDGVSIEIAPGEFVAITGPSGGGKSTLLALLGGLDRPSSGTVYAAGAPLDQLSQGALDDYRLQRVGTIFQTFNLVPSLSALDNVALPLALAGVSPSERRRRGRLLLELVGLGHRAGFRPGRLAGGEQQRVAVARALANRPGLVLADEPTGNLDTSRGEAVMNLLEDLNRRGATVVLVTHDPELARRAQRAIHLRDGRVVSDSGNQRRTGRAPDTLAAPDRLSRTDALKLGLGSTRRRPLRTALTATGVAMGIAVMSLILALASGLQQQVIDSVNSGGQLQQVLVQPTKPNSTEHVRLDKAAVTALGQAPHVQAAWGEVVISGAVAPADNPAAAAPGIVYSLPPHDQVPASGITLVAGRMPGSNTIAEGVMSAEQAKRLGWSPSQAIGKRVVFKGQFPAAVPAGKPAAVQVPLALTIVGVASSTQQDNQPWIRLPATLADNYWTASSTANGWQQDPYAGLVVLATSMDRVQGVRDEVQAKGYAALTSDDQLRDVAQRLRYADLALTGLAVLALLIAALLIINTMLSAVLERTREIGVLKAVGARARDVTLIFVTEAALIGATAGVIGVIAAAVLSRAANSVVDDLARGQGAHLDLRLFQLGPLIVVAALAFAVVLSMLSGLLPALRAARLDPIQALRYE